MHETRTPIDPELLIQQVGWLNGVTRRLARDPGRAEDVAQDTLLAALAAPPPDAAEDGRLKAWMGRVAFNLSHLDLRKTARRRAREEQVAQGESQGSTLDRVERLSVARHVSSAVSALPEPYRTTILLRYFEDLSTAEIAARTESTETAVRKRLWRARERLRRQLEPRAGAPSWVGAWLAPFLPGRSPLEGLRLAPRQALFALASVAVLVAFVPALTHSVRGEDLASADPGQLVRIAPARTHSSFGTPPGDPDDARPGNSKERRTLSEGLATTPSSDGEVVSTVPPAPPAPRVRRSGDVLGFSSGALLPGVAVRRPDGEVLAHSDSGGGFRFASERAALSLEAGGGGLLPLNRVRLGATDGRPATLMVARGFPLAGTVSGPRGRLANAEVRLVLDLGAPTDGRSELREYHTSTDAQGHYSFAALPQGEGLSLAVHAPGHVSESASLATPLSALEFHLQGVTPLAVRLEGRVQDDRGRALADLEMAFGPWQTRTDEQGHYRFEGLLESATLPPVRVNDPDWIPVRGTVGQSGRKDLVLTRAGRVSGGIEDEDGHALPGWWVTAVSARDLAEVPDLVVDPLAQASRRTRTDRFGRFMLAGLEHDAHVLVAVDPDGARCLTRGFDVGEADMHLRLVPAAGYVGRLRASSLAEAPAFLDGAWVQPQVRVTSPLGPFQVRLAAILADEQGLFNLPDLGALSPGALAAMVDHPALAGPQVLELAQTGLATDVSPVRRFEVAPHPQLARVRFLDGQGVALLAAGPIERASTLRVPGAGLRAVRVPGEAHSVEYELSSGERVRLPLAQDPSRCELVLDREPAALDD